MTQTTIPEWTLGWRLQRSLAHAEVSIEEMAAELGVSRQSVSRWLNERGVPRVGYMKLWALRTGVPLEWLMSGGIRRPARYTPRADLPALTGLAA
jgi:transcriptional regulator with XRE-family HTH domain